MPPLRDVAAAVVTEKGVLLGDRLERLVVVAQYQDVPIGLMAKEIKDAKLLHPAGYEGQCCLAVLDAEVEWLVAAGQPTHLVIGEPVFTEDRFDDLWNRLLLKDAAVGCTAQKPQPRDDLGMVLAITA